MKGRSADETEGLAWHELRTGDAVYVYQGDQLRVARVHRAGDPIPLEAADVGAWATDGVKGDEDYMHEWAKKRAPFTPVWFGVIGSYIPTDKAWKRLVGVSLPGGNDYYPEEENDSNMGNDEDNKLAKKKEPEWKNVGVMFVDQPDKPYISLPKEMTFKTAREWLTKMENEENKTFVFQYQFKGWFPLDAMWATYRALAEMHGFVHVGDMPGFWRNEPPTMVTIETAYRKKQQIPWGAIEVNSFSAPFIPSITLVQGVPTLQFDAQIRNKEREQADKLMKKAEEFLEKESIYRGRAIEADFEVVSPMNFKFDPTKAPTFWDTTGTKVEDIILPDEVQDLVQTSLWTPIEKSQLCRVHKIPLRRGILLAGKYGVGKTLAARITAKLCEENGWTYLYLKKLEQLPQALKFAKKYEPCVVFAEDVNRVASGERTQAMDDLFNLIDGVDRKNDEVMVVFTTNELEKIHAGMLRPGRIDSVITVTPPDSKAAQQLMRLYGQTLIDPNEDLSTAGELLAGQIPALIRETVERSKLAAIKDAKPGQPLRVSGDHLVTAAKQMLLHAKLLEEPEAPKPDLQVLGEAFGAVFAEGVRASIPIPNYDGSNEQAQRHGVKAILDDAGRPGTNGRHITE